MTSAETPRDSPIDTYRVGRDEPTSPACADRSVRRISAHIRRWQRCRHRPRSPRRRAYRPPSDLPGTPGAAVRPGPVAGDRQRQPQRHVRQRAPGADRRHPGRSAPQHRQPGRPGAEFRRGQARGVRGPAADDVDIRSRSARAARPGPQPRTQPAADLPPAAVPVRCAAEATRRPSSRGTRAARSRAIRAAGTTRPCAHPGVARFPTTFATGARVGDGDGPDGRTALERGEPRDEHAEDPAARPSRRSAAGLDQDRPQHRQRHRHPRRAGVAPPRDPGAHRRRHRDPRQPQHQRDIRQRVARRNGGPARGRHGHHRQRRPGVPRGHAGPPHRDCSRHQHRRPRCARRHVDHRGQQDAAGQHLADGAARHADRRSSARRVRASRPSPGWWPATPTRRPARWPSRVTTSTPSTPRCAPGSGWCPRTTWCTAS